MSKYIIIKRTKKQTKSFEGYDWKHVNDYLDKMTSNKENEKLNMLNYHPTKIVEVLSYEELEYIKKNNCFPKFIVALFDYENDLENIKNICMEALDMLKKVKKDNEEKYWRIKDKVWNFVNQQMAKIPQIEKEKEKIYESLKKEIQIAHKLLKIGKWTYE